MQLRKSLLVVSFLIGCMPVLKAQTITTQQYIAMYKDIAIAEMRRSGVPAAIKLAQGILETQSGNGWLVLHSNNHFGIKCKNNWVGETVNYDDDARQECFRKYPSAADSYRDHSTFLRNNPRYAFLFEFAPEDYKSWAYGLKQAGYATSRIYPQQLIKIIEENHLQQYTQEGLGAPRNTSLAVSPDNSRPQDQQPPAVNRPATRPAKAATAARRPDANKVFEINGRKVLYLPKGTALIQVADRHNIRLSRLLKYNDLPADAPLPADMYIYLQKKSKKGKDDYHVVAQGESMHDVAQAEGIQMKWLRRRNRMQEGEEPAPGEKLALDGYANRTPRLVKGATPKTDEDNYSLTPEGQGLTKADAPAQPAPAPAPAPPAAAAQNSGIPVAMVEDLKKVARVTPAGSGPQAGTPRPDTTPATQPAAADRITGILQYHDVQPKETAYGIAKRYHITIEQLQRWNNLPTTDLKIGQRLLVGK